MTHDQLRALSILARSSNGRTEALMVAQGFTEECLDELIEAGLASAKTERVLGIEITRLHITEAGRRALK